MFAHERHNADLTFAYLLTPIPGEHPRRIDNVRRVAQKRRMAHYRTLAMKDGHIFTLWQWIAKATARTECHECEASLTVDFTLDRADELIVSDALDTPCPS